MSVQGGRGMTKIFKLPDLGEGMQEAEIIEWHVKEGDEVRVDQPLVSMETDKAIVEVPSPHAGRIEELYGQAHDVVHVGAPLVGFEGAEDADAGTVVGHMPVGRGVVAETAVGVGHAGPGVKATPAVRALAHRLGVDLALITPSGPDGLVTTQDVQRVAQLLEEWGPPEMLRGGRWRRTWRWRSAKSRRPPLSTTRMSMRGRKARTLRSGSSERSSPVVERRPRSTQSSTAPRLHDHAVQLRHDRRQIRGTDRDAADSRDPRCRPHPRPSRGGEWAAGRASRVAAFADLRPPGRNGRRGHAISQRRDNRSRVSRLTGTRSESGQPIVPPSNRATPHKMNTNPPVALNQRLLGNVFSARM